MEIRNTAEEIRNTGQLSEENEQRIAFKIGWQSATRRNGLVTTRDGLLARIQKHGVSWKGDYFDEGVFATRVPKTKKAGSGKGEQKGGIRTLDAILFKGSHQILACVLFQ